VPWRAVFPTGELCVTDQELNEFSEIFVAMEELRSRISKLLIFELYVWDKIHGIHPSEVMREIGQLELGDGYTGTKPASKFQHPPLKGLWHKHFFSARFLVNNISNAFRDGTAEQIIREVCDPKKSETFTEQMANELAHRLTHEPLVQREKDQKLTGEWIVFRKYSGKNYYLTLATHHEGDQRIFDRIVKFADNY
jgi:mRNA-degrading endonuclease YafQ of YafQ-DinJ toxin-antitoxin module